LILLVIRTFASAEELAFISQTESLP